jgi:hypothetical protein
MEEREFLPCNTRLRFASLMRYGQAIPHCNVGIVSRLLLSCRPLVLPIKDLEIYLGQVHWRKARAGNDVRNIRAKVRIHDVGATNTEKRIKLRGRYIPHFKNSSLFRLNKKGDLVVDLRRERDGHRALENMLVLFLGNRGNGNFNARGFLFKKNCRRVRLLKRQALEVHTLNLK